MPRRGLVVGSLVLMAGNGVLIAAAPEEYRVFTIITVLIGAALLGSLIAYFLRLRCRVEIPWPYGSVRWSVRKERNQLALREIARVTTLLDETSDEAAHHVVFELKNGKHVRLSDYSWAIPHAAKLALRIGEFLDRVPPGRSIPAAIDPDE